MAGPAPEAEHKAAYAGRVAIEDSGEVLVKMQADAAPAALGQHEVRQRSQSIAMRGNDDLYGAGRRNSQPDDEGQYAPQPERCGLPARAVPAERHVQVEGGNSAAEQDG